MKRPGPDHPITIEPAAERIVVTFAGKVIADTTRAQRLAEGGYPPVLYIPREDVAMDLMARTSQSSTCPYKGQASYYSIEEVDGRGSANAAWSYEAPYDWVAAIGGHLAFYPDRVDNIDVTPAGKAA